MSGTLHPEIIPRAEDQDSLCILPLCILPVESQTMKRARVIKNARLDSVVEVFRDRESGSGQLDIEKIPQELNWPQCPPHPDFVLLRKLALMPSYDVYSLRILLRGQGIEVNSHDALKLSPGKMRELGGYMKNFTRPLLLQIYGETESGVETLDDVVSMFRDPDMEKAKRRLTMMARTLGLEIHAIPRFLEDYADIFLSLSYYRQCLDRITPTVYDFIDALNDLKKSYQMRTNTALMTTCEEMRATFSDLLVAVTGRLEGFERCTKDMWHDLSADRFRKLERLIRAYHTTMGGILCALAVKMDAWADAFPVASHGGPVRRAEFIMSDMKHGLAHIRKVCKDAPPISEFSAAA